MRAIEISLDNRNSKYRKEKTNDNEICGDNRDRKGNGKGDIG